MFWDKEPILSWSYLQVAIVKSDFLYRAKPRNVTQLNQPRGSYLCGTCKYVTEDAHYTDHIHSTLQLKPDL